MVGQILVIHFFLILKSFNPKNPNSDLFFKLLDDEIIFSGQRFFSVQILKFRKLLKHLMTA
jgi:hypothetical protein